MSEAAASARPRAPAAQRHMRMLLFCAAFLCVAGWVMLLDTGLIFEGQADPAHFHSLIVKRALCSLIGLILLIALWIAPPQKLRAFAPLAILIAITLLALVWSPLGVAERGSRRWVDLGPFTFQPLEFAKLALVWFLACILARIGPLDTCRLSHLLLPAALVVLIVGMVGAQPNLSGAAFLLMLAFVMAWLGGMNLRLAFTMTVLGSMILSALIALNPDRLARFLPVFRPLSDLDGAGYQVGMSLWAVTNGELLGRGPGGSIAMYSLPDHATDFIYSIVCEEWGLVGGLAIVALFALFIYSAFRLALDQRDPFRLLFGCGIAAILALQVAMNIGVTLGLLPTTGVPLPFLSAGGSNLLLTLGEVGLLLNLGRTAGVSAEEQLPTEHGEGRDALHRPAPRPGRKPERTPEASVLYPGRRESIAR